MSGACHVFYDHIDDLNQISRSHLFERIVLYRSVYYFMLKHERGRKNTTFLLFDIIGKLFEYSFPYTLHNENLIIVD